MLLLAPPLPWQCGKCHWDILITVDRINGPLGSPSPGVYLYIRQTNFELHGSDHGLAAKSCLTLATPWTVAHQAPLFVGFPRQEYWSGVIPSPGDLPGPGIESKSPALKADSLRT